MKGLLLGAEVEGEARTIIMRRALTIRSTSFSRVRQRGPFFYRDEETRLERISVRNQGKNVA